MPDSTADPSPPAGSAETIPRLPPPQFEPRAEGQPRLSLFTGTTGESEVLNRAIKRPRHVQSAPIPSPPLEMARVDPNRGGGAATVEAQQPTPATSMASASATATTNESASASASAKRPRLSLSTSSQTSSTPTGRLLTPVNHEPSPEPLRSQGAALVNKVLNRIVLFRRGEAERRAKWGGDPRLWDEYSAIEFALVSFSNDEAAHAVFSPIFLVKFKKTLHGQWMLAQATPFSWQQFQASMKRVQSLINHLRALYCSTRLCQALPPVDESQWIDIVRAPSNLDSTSPQRSPSSTYHSPPLPATAQFATFHATPESAPGHPDHSRPKPSRPIPGMLGTEHPPSPAASPPTPVSGETLPAMPTSSVILPPRHRSRLGIPRPAPSLGASSPPTNTSQTSKQGSNSTPSLGISGRIVYGSSASWNTSPFLSSSAMTPPAHRSMLAQSPPQFQAQLGPSPPPPPPQNPHIPPPPHWSQPRGAPQSGPPGPVHPHPQGPSPTHQSPPLGGLAGPFPLQQPQQPQIPIEAELQRIYEMGVSAGRRYEHEQVGKERVRAEAEAASQAQAQARLSQAFVQAQAQTQAQMQALEKTKNQAKVQKQALARSQVPPQAAPQPNGSGHAQMQSPTSTYGPFRSGATQNQGSNMPQIGNARPSQFSEASSPTLPHTQAGVPPNRAPSPTEQFRASLHRPTAFIEGAEGLPDHLAPVYVLLNLATAPDIAKGVLIFLLDTLRISTALDVLVTQLRDSARQFIKRPPADHHQLLVRVVSFYNAFAEHTTEQLKSGGSMLHAFGEGTLRVNQSEHAKIIASFEQAKNADRVCEILARAIETWQTHVNKRLGQTPPAAPPRPRSQSGETQGVPLLQNGQAGVRPSSNHTRHLSTSLGPSSVRPANNGTGAPSDSPAAGKPTHRASRNESNVVVPQNLLPPNNARAPPRRLSGPLSASTETTPSAGPETRPPSRPTPPPPQPVQPTARDRLRAKRDELVPALEKVLEIVDSFQQQSTAHEDYAALVQRFEAAKIERARQNSVASASPTS